MKTKLIMKIYSIIKIYVYLHLKEMKQLKHINGNRDLHCL